MSSYAARRSLARTNAAKVRGYDREAREHLAAVAAEREARAKAAHEARLAKDAADHAAALPLIPTLERKDFIRTRHDWHEVVRVNAKTVTVTTPTWLYGGTERIPFAKVLEVRKAAK